MSICCDNAALFGGEMSQRVNFLHYATGFATYAEAHGFTLLLQYGGI